MLRTRIWTAAVALPALLAVIIFSPNWFFTAFIALIGGWGLYEVLSMTAASGAGAIAAVAAAGAIPMLTMLARGDGGMWWIPTVVTAAMLALVAEVARRGGEHGPKGLALTTLGAIYVGVLFPYFAILRNHPDGVATIILMLLVVVASDTGAYFVGTWIGRTKLAPLVSPNKSVEGAVGGLLASIGAGLILRPMLVANWSVAMTAGVSAAIAILAQLGDLAGSAFKRSAGVKDSGWIFPGHGGLIDRTCSLVFASVFTYYAMK